MMTRKPVSGPFRVLIVPRQDSPSVNAVTIPRMLTDRVPVLAMAYSNEAVEAAFWAFTPAQKKQIVKNLRALANFLETPS